jgi:hypothetical protein
MDSCEVLVFHINEKSHHEEHLADHKSFIEYSVYQGTCLHDDFSHLCEIPKLHKNPYRESNYLLQLICNVSYHFEDNRVLKDFLKRLYTIPR